MKRGRGRPRLWTPERLARLSQLIAGRATSKVAAIALGVTPDAVRTAASHYGLRFRRPR